MWLAVAAGLKLVDPAHFRSALVAQGAITGRWLTIALWGAPSLELASSAIALPAMVHHRLRVAALTIASVFLGLASYALYLDRHTPPSPAPCGCGLSRRPVEHWAPIALQNALIGTAFGFGACVRTRGQSNAHRRDDLLPRGHPD